MPRIVNLPTFKDSRGNLTVLERILPFPIKRVFFIYDVTAPRGGHGHKNTRIALVSLSGSVRIECQCPDRNYEYHLTSPDQCLILEPEDWHLMDSFTSGATLVALASEEFNKEDYFFEKYR